MSSQPFSPTRSTRLSIGLAGPVIIFGLVLTFVLAPAASAFTVTPIRLELAGDPGIVLSSEFKVYNDTNQTQTFYTSIQNFETQDETGNPKFVNTKEGLASWVTLAPSVIAKPRQEVAITFKIDIPKDAEPGGYFAGLFATTTSPAVANSSSVELGSRIGTLLLLRVNGDIPEGISILEFGTTNHHRFYSMLPINFYYRFQNSGGDRIKPLGDILIKNIFGRTAKILNANRVDGNVLPKSIRRFESAWIRAGGDVKQDPAQDPAEAPPQTGQLGFFAAAKAELANFAFGPYTAHLNLAYGNTTAKGATASYSFFVIPWQLLLIVIVLLLIVLFFLRLFVRRYNLYIINQAKR